MSDRRKLHKPVFRQWECWRCKIDIGVATSVAVDVMLSPMIGADNRVRKRMSTKQTVCAYCLSRGEMTRVQ